MGNDSSKKKSIRNQKNYEIIEKKEDTNNLIEKEEKIEIQKEQAILLTENLYKKDEELNEIKKRNSGL